MGRPHAHGATSEACEVVLELSGKETGPRPRRKMLCFLRRHCFYNAYILYWSYALYKCKLLRRSAQAQIGGWGGRGTVQR